MNAKCKLSKEAYSYDEYLANFRKTDQLASLHLKDSSFTTKEIVRTLDLNDIYPSYTKLQIEKKQKIKEKTLTDHYVV